MSDYREEADDLAEFTWGLEGPGTLETSRCAIQQALLKAHKKGRAEALQECLAATKKFYQSPVQMILEIQALIDKGEK